MARKANTQSAIEGGSLLARAPGSPVTHRVIDRSATETLCGKSARLMAKWASSEAGVDARVWRPCEKCRT